MIPLHLLDLNLNYKIIYFMNVIIMHDYDIHEVNSFIYSYNKMLEISLIIIIIDLYTRYL